MFRYRLLIFLTGMLFGQTGDAQHLVIDSLKKVLGDHQLPVDTRIRTMTQLGRAMSATDLPGALQLEKEALQLSHATQDAGYCALSYASLSQVYNGMDSLTLASLAMDSALWYAERTSDKGIKGMVWYRKGRMEDKLDQLQESFKSFLTAIQLLEGAHEYSTEANIYYFMSGSYGNLNDLENEEKYAQLCLKTALLSGLPDDLCNAYQTMGSSLQYRYRKDTTKKQLLEACMYHNRLAYNIARENSNRLLIPSILSVIALNISNLYAEFYPYGYKDSAIYYLDIALVTGQQTKQKSVVASCLGQLSDYARRDGDYKKAENYLLEALSVLNSQRTTNSAIKIHILHNLADIAEQKGDKTKALDYYKQYVDYYQSFFNSEQLAAANKLEAQYESGKNERDLLVVQQQAAFNKKLNMVYLILIIASLLALLFLFRSYHFRLRLSTQRQKLLEQENEDAELRAYIAAAQTRQLGFEKQEAALRMLLKEEETARLYAEQQLLETRKAFLQKELLAGSLALEEKNELLQSLQKKISEISDSDPRFRKVGRIITERTRLDEDFESLKQDFAQIHPEFIIQLQQKADNGLTRIDLKYCVYILMGLSNKEIGSRLGIEAKSIRMARYRIKLKLGLEKEESLDQYIRTLA